MKTKDLLSIIFYSSGGVFISPTLIKGRDNKIASAFRVFYARNKTYFNVFANRDGVAFYELTKECCVSLFGVSDTLFIGQSFSQVSMYERILRSTIAIEAAHIIPVTRKIVSINNANYVFLNEAFLSSGKRASVVCDKISSDLMSDNFNSIYIPRVLRSVKISQGVRSFFQMPTAKEEANLEFKHSQNGDNQLEKNTNTGKDKLNNEGLVSLWETFFHEISIDPDTDISSLFTKNELIDLSMQMNDAIKDLDFEHPRYVIGNIKHLFLKLIYSKNNEEWEFLRQAIKEQWSSLFGRAGQLNSEDEVIKSKLKELIELASTEYSKAQEINKRVYELILPNAPFYSISNFFNIISKFNGNFSKEPDYDIYLIRQFKSTLIMHFINNPNIMSRHSKIIEQIINNDMDIFNGVMLSFVIKDSKQ